MFHVDNMIGMPEEVEEVEKKMCRCGKPVRPKQRDCYACHSESVLRSRLAHRKDHQKALDAKQVIIDKLIPISHPDTKSAFEMRLSGVHHVLVMDDGPRPASPGLVVGFLPDMMLLVLTNTDRFQKVPLSRVIRDPAKQWKI